MKVAVLGCGSLGGVMAAGLADRPGLELTVIDKDPHVTEAIAKQGLILRRGRSTVRRTVKVSDSATDGPFEALLIATKAASLGAAAKSLLTHLAPEASVITVQNGLVALDLAEIVGAERLVAGCVLWGASMEAPGEYRITNSGKFIVGGLEGTRTTAVDRAQTVLSHIFPTELSPNISGVLWSKLAITTTFTTLGAITGLPFGPLASNTGIRRIILEIGRELYRVGRTEGVTFEPLSAALNMEKFLSDSGGYSPAVKHLLIRVLGFKNRHDESSMLDSLRNGQKTEIDFINGRLVRSAVRAGIAVPFNQRAVELIGEMERGERSPAVDNLTAFQDLG